MNGELTGKNVVSNCSNNYEIGALLGRGGQGEVYEARCGTQHYALKWYYKHTATEGQKTRLHDLISKGAPDSSLFLWPIDLIETSNDRFGYIMRRRPKEYKNLVDLMKRRAEPSFFNLCRAAFNLSKGFKALHDKGWCYGDVSFGNVFFSDSGDVLICDNDNVVPNGGESATYGTPRFMAPEIVRGERKPSRLTDQYSLAVLLFYMFMLGNPLEGKLEADIKCLDIPAMNRLYGEHPVFVYDPNDLSNRPVKGYQENVIEYWKLYPKFFRDLFTKSFTEGLQEPNKRTTEVEWAKALANLMSSIMICPNPNCGVEMFFDPAVSSSCTCWGCKRVVSYSPTALVSGRRFTLLYEGANIYSHAIRGDFDMEKVIGVVVQHPNNPRLWGIKNLSTDNWTYIRADGSQIPVATGKTASIVKGAKVNFGCSEGVFKQF